MVYQSQNNENVAVEVLYNEEDFWLTQKSMSELFGVGVNTINYHLKEIFKTKELQEESVIRKIRITANDGKKYDTNFYNSDVIIAVGYRVNSKEATDFRIWVTKIARRTKMKIRNNARNGVLISTAILVIALAILLIVNSIPNIDILSATDKLRYDFINKEEIPIWKIIGYIIVGILLVLSAIVNFVMCRCHHCGRHIHFMNIFIMYCPYCSKSLDITK